ncbi:hypothetical protein Tco_1119470 [Tanacetum coccineum]
MGCCREGGDDGVIMVVDGVEEGGGMEIIMANVPPNDPNVDTSAIVPAPANPEHAPTQPVEEDPEEEEEDPEEEEEDSEEEEEDSEEDPEEDPKEDPEEDPEEDP